MTDPVTDPATVPVLVVGYDDSPGSRAALRVAVGLAGRLGGALHVVHAVEPTLPAVSPVVTAGAVTPPDAYLTPGQTQTAHDTVRAAATRLLEDVSVEWTWAEGTGRAADVLDAHAEERDAYLLVVGSRSPSFGTGVEHVLFGSTVSELRRAARRPLLLVPGGEGRTDTVTV